VDPGWRTGGAAGARADPQGLNNYLMSAGAGRGAPRTGYLPGSGVLRWWARAEKGAAGARADPQGLNNYLISAGAGRGAPRTGYLPGSGVLRWWARAERGGEAPASPGGRPPGARQLNIFLSSTTIFEATPFIYPATLFHPPTCRSCFRRFGAVFFPNNALMCSFYTDPPIALLKVRVKHRKRDFVVGAIFRSGLRPRGVRTLGRMHPGAAGCEAPRGPASTRQPRSPNPNKQTVFRRFTNFRQIRKIGNFHQVLFPPAHIWPTRGWGLGCGSRRLAPGALGGRAPKCPVTAL
jgi:hypothetical protein